MWIRPSEATAIVISFWFPEVSVSLTRTFGPNGASRGEGIGGIVVPGDPSPDAGIGGIDVGAMLADDKEGKSSAAPANPGASAAKAKMTRMSETLPRTLRPSRACRMDA